jgi:hypothetical protein
MTPKKPSPGLFRETPYLPQTPFEKTAAAAKQITETDAKKRAELSATLKAARLERHVGADPAPASDTPPKAAPKSSR